MPKHFKTKKVIRKLSIIKYIFFIIIAWMLIKICIYSLNYMSPITYYYPKLLIVDYYNILKNNTINQPVNLLNYKTLTKTDIKPVIKEETVSNKKIYIYSTHQTEKYSDGKSVVSAANYMKEMFETQNIDVYVEEGSISEFLIANNYSYNYSYVASRYFIEEEIEQNSYDLIIDLHRDAVSRNASVTTVDGKKCARIMFVIGKKNNNYKENYQLAKKINQLIEDKYSTLSRGILLQDGANVNGVYNQDLNDKMILIELGGNKNSYQEVKNTIDLIVPIIGDYLNGKKI